jgi:hypothetical protein
LEPPRYQPGEEYRVIRGRSRYFVLPEAPLSILFYLTISGSSPCRNDFKITEYVITQKSRLDKLLINCGIAPTLEKACLLPVWGPAGNREFFILARKKEQNGN